MAKTRRGRGEGNIYQRPDGRWAARISVGHRMGKRDRRWVYAKSHSEVVAKLRGLASAAENHLLPAPGRISVRQFLEDWLADTAKPKLRPATHRSYEQLIRLHIVPSLGAVDLKRLTPAQMQRCLIAVGKNGASPRTVQYVRAVLRSSLAHALRGGRLPATLPLWSKGRV